MTPEDAAWRDRLASIDPRIHDMVESLRELELEIIEDVDFQDAEVYMDGRKFVNCTFTGGRCIVLVGGFALDGCDFEGVTFFAEGPANMIRLLFEATQQGEFHID